MKNFHIEIDINDNGNMFICEDGCTGEHYHIVGTLDDLIDQITTCLADYLHNEHDDMEDNNMAKEEFIKKLGHTCKELLGTTEKPNNLMSTDGELKQWQKDIMENSCIMSRAERQEFLKPNDLAEKAKLQKNSLYGKAVRENDPVNHPSHYTDGKIEVIDFIEDKKLNFHLANAVKYISRAGKKDPSKEIEDLKKAMWYLDRYIQKLEEANNGGDPDGDEIELFAGYDKLGKIPVNKEETTNVHRAD